MNNFEKLIEFLKLFHAQKNSWKIYLLLSLYFIILIVSGWLEWKILILLIIFLVVIVMLGVFSISEFYTDLNVMINKMSKYISVSEEDSLYQSPIAVLLYDDNFLVRWINPSFQHIYGTKEILGITINEIDPALNQIMNNKSVDREWHEIQLNEKHYKYMHQIDYQAIYLMDVTNEIEMIELKKYEKIVFGFLFLDDYDELIQSLEDHQESKLDSELLNDLNNWSNIHGIYLKRIDYEKFILIMNMHTLEKIEQDKFKLLESLTEKNYLQNFSIAISVGLAYSDSDKYEVNELAQQAQLNLDLALGRGGNQVVVKSQEGKARFYGGKENPVEKRTNIRSKQVYQALKTSVEQASNIFITGHKYLDLDAIGSAIGMYKLLSAQNKSIKIIVNQNEFNNDVALLLNTPQLKNEWTNMFTDIDTALQTCNEKTLIIMVDHHRPTLSEAQPLIEGHDVVVIDHHRRSEDFPKNSVLTFIEPYASSTAELITEFFIYMRESNLSLNKFEATALLGGIIVDTNNFSHRTGSRTFDAASYLKSKGANTSQIQRLLKEDIDNMRKRNEIMDTVAYEFSTIAIAIGKADQTYDNVVASQAADELLNLKDIEASFVIYNRIDNRVGISARSLGTVNVQTIMERMGGGGHLSNAATQLIDIDLNEARNILMEVLAEMEENIQ